MPPRKVLLAAALVLSALPAATQAAEQCMDARQRELLEAINAVRAEPRDCGKRSFPAAPPLRWHCKLVAAAERHSADMASNNFMDHQGSDGKRVLERLRDAGYSPQAWGENVAAGRDQAAPTVYAWLGSPQHCANVMKHSFTHVGGARAEDGDSYYRWYWTVAFARPRR